MKRKINIIFKLIMALILMLPLQFMEVKALVIDDIGVKIFTKAGQLSSVMLTDGQYYYNDHTIKGEDDGTANATYNQTENTLTLSGYDSGSISFVSVDKTKDLKIVLKGSNTISVNPNRDVNYVDAHGNQGFGIYVPQLNPGKDFEITSQDPNGYLRIRANDQVFDTTGIFVDKNNMKITHSAGVDTWIISNTMALQNAYGIKVNQGGLSILNSSNIGIEIAQKGDNLVGVTATTVLFDTDYSSYVEIYNRNNAGLGKAIDGNLHIENVNQLNLESRNFPYNEAGLSYDSNKFFILKEDGVYEGNTYFVRDFYDKNQHIEPTEIKVTPNAVEIFINEEVKLKYEILPPGSPIIEGVIWSVEDENIAVIDADGKLTGINPGTTKVIVKSKYKDDLINKIDVVILSTEGYHNVNVTSGTGGGLHKVGDNVTITANDAPTNKKFSHWVSSYDLGINLDTPIISFVMPDVDVDLEAVYEFKEIQNIQWKTGSTISFDAVPNATIYLVRVLDKDNQPLHDNQSSLIVTEENGRITADLLHRMIDSLEEGTQVFNFVLMAWDDGRARVAADTKTTSRELTIGKLDKPTNLRWVDGKSVIDPVDGAKRYQYELWKYENGTAKRETWVSQRTVTEVQFDNISNEEKGIYFFRVQAESNSEILKKSSDFALSDTLVIGNPVYTLNVHNADGSGLYQVGDIVKLEANPGEHETFLRWESADFTLIDVTVPKMTFYMPNKNITITAIYKSKEALTLDGLVDNETLTYSTHPQSPTGQISVQDHLFPVSDLEVKYESTDGKGYEAETPPTNVGKYKVTYKIPDTNKEFYGEVTYTFEIEKATPTPEIPQGLKGLMGNLLESVPLPERYEYQVPTYKMQFIGQQPATVFYYPEDTENYEVIYFDVYITVVQGYNIAVETTPGGTASVDKHFVGYGETITLTEKANEGYKFVGWHVEPYDVEITNNKFSMIHSSLTITAQFEKIESDVMYTYELLEGANATWILGQEENLIIKIDANHLEFDELLINGNVVDPKHYQISEGSTIIELFASYLNTLKEGVQNVGIVFKNTAVSTEFVVKEKAVDPSDPTDPVDPVDPIDPTDPVDPVDPIDPVNPVDPTDPTKPVDPEVETPLPKDEDKEDSTQKPLPDIITKPKEEKDDLSDKKDAQLPLTGAVSMLIPASILIGFAVLLHLKNKKRKDI